MIRALHWAVLVFAITAQAQRARIRLPAQKIQFRSTVKNDCEYLLSPESDDQVDSQTKLWIFFKWMWPLQLRGLGFMDAVGLSAQKITLTQTGDHSFAFNDAVVFDLTQKDGAKKYQVLHKAELESLLSERAQLVWGPLLTDRYHEVNNPESAWRQANKNRLVVLLAIRKLAPLKPFVNASDVISVRAQVRLIDPKAPIELITENNRYFEILIPALRITLRPQP